MGKMIDMPISIGMTTIANRVVLNRWKGATATRTEVRIS